MGNAPRRPDPVRDFAAKRPVAVGIAAALALAAVLLLVDVLVLDGGGSKPLGIGLVVAYGLAWTAKGYAWRRFTRSKPEA